MSGRPVSRSVLYFPHSAAEPEELRILVRRFGWRGYVVYFRMRERLSETEGLAVDLSDEPRQEDFASQCWSTWGEVKSVVDLLARLGYLDGELWTRQTVAWSEAHVESLRPVFAHRARARGGEVTMPSKPGGRGNGEGEGNSC